MAITVNAPTIPERAADQDEAIVVLVLRRTDPGNPTGSPMPDISDALVNNTEASLSMANNVAALGFDPEQSYLTVASLTDVEQGGAITAAALISMLTPPADPPADAPPAE